MSASNFTQWQRSALSMFRALNQLREHFTGRSSFQGLVLFLREKGTNWIANALNQQTATRSFFLFFFCCSTRQASNSMNSRNSLTSVAFKKRHESEQPDHASRSEGCETQRIVLQRLLEPEVEVHGGLPGCGSRHRLFFFVERELCSEMKMRGSENEPFKQFLSKGRGV